MLENDLLRTALNKLDLSEKEKVFLGTACGLKRPTISDIIKQSGLKKPTAYKKPTAQ